MIKKRAKIEKRAKTAAGAITKRRRGPNEVDKYVSARLKARRELCLMSQTELAESLGISFQQVQKYERGANRITSGTLYAITQILETPMEYFFEGIEWENGKPIVPVIPPRVRKVKKTNPVIP